MFLWAGGMTWLLLGSGLADRVYRGTYPVREENDRAGHQTGNRYRRRVRRHRRYHRRRIRRDRTLGVWWGYDG